MKHRYLVSIAPVILAIGLYAYSVRLPIFLDDGLHYAMIRDYGVEGVPPFRFWGGSLSYHHYRPLIFTILELDYEADRRFDPFILHLYSVLQFGLLTAGIVALTQRLTNSRFAGLAAGFLFALYPLNVRAVTWVAANFHINAALSIVLTLCFGLMWLDKRGGGVSLIFAYLGLLYGLFSQENTIFVPLFLFLSALFVHGWRVLWTWRARVLFIPLGFFTFIYLWLWFTLPRPAAGPVIFHGDTALASLAVLLQGIAYPLVAFVRRLTLENARTIPLLLLVAGCLVMAFALVGRRWWFVMILCLSFSLLISLPFIFFLPTDYVKGSPHVYLLPAVGIAMFWGCVVGGVFGPRPLHRAWYVRAGRLALICWILAGLIIGLSYMRSRRDEALRLSNYVWDLMEILQNPSEQTVLVNAPAFLSALDTDRWFLTGSEATMFMEGSYTRYEYIFHAMTGQPYEPIVGLVYPPGFVPPPSYVYAPFWTENPQDFTNRLKQFQNIIVTRFEGDNFYPISVGGAGWPPLSEADEPSFVFANGAIAFISARPTLNDTILTIPIRWRVERPINAVPRLTILCENQIIAEHEASPWGGTHPFYAWSVGETQTDIHTLRLQSNVATDCLRLHIQLVYEGQIIEGVSTQEGVAEGIVVGVTDN